MDTTAVDCARKEIDRINSELVKLLIQRMLEVDKVAEWKAANGQPVFVPAREEAIIEKVCAQAGAEFAPEIEAIFRAVFAASRAREERLINR